ncbi:MAG: cob(I)yrinic acid a,c-diamide adenosyltransferase [Clostridiales bacterium]|nr:cob(I)yrinic acid a,c-diamide adenosyltransferase [Clostridiales bacterium]
MEQGRIHVYCGGGKGKTTAAIGLSVRAVGRGYPVVLSQFLKGSNSGELPVLEKLPDYHIVPSPKVLKFIFQMTAEEKEACKVETTRHFEDTIAEVQRVHAKLLVMDEVLDAVATGMLSDAKLADFLKNRPSDLEVVMTGREPTPCVEPLADYITRMEKVRHPFDKGLSARIGVEY